MKLRVLSAQAKSLYTQTHAKFCKKKKIAYAISALMRA